jgi:O-antigen/teichoic acid export membrane protein
VTIREGDQEIPAEPLDRRAVATGFAWLFSFNIVGKLLLPILTIVVARIVGRDAIGLYGLLLAMLGMAEVFRDAGLAQTYIADREVSHARSGAYHSLSILSGLVLALLVLASMPWLIAFFPGLEQAPWTLYVVSLAILLNGFGTMPLANLMKAGRFRDAGLADVGSAVLSYATTLVLVLLGFGFEALMVQMLMYAALYCLAANLLAPARSFDFSPSGLGRVFRRAASLLASNVLATVYLIGDAFLVGRLLGTGNLGYYTPARMLAIRPVEMISVPLGRTLFVAYSRISVEGGAFARTYARSVVAAVIAATPIYVLLGVFAVPLVDLLLGAEFAGAAGPLAALSVMFGTRAVGTLSGAALVASGRPGATVACWALAYVVAAAGFLAFRERLDVTVAASIVAAGAGVTYAAMTVWTLYRHRPEAAERRRLLQAAATSVLTLAAALGLRFLTTDLPPVVVVVLALVAVPAVHLAALGTIFAGSPTVYTSLRGVRRLWREL